MQSFRGLGYSFFTSAPPHAAIFAQSSFCELVLVDSQGKLVQVSGTTFIFATPEFDAERAVEEGGGGASRVMTSRHENAHDAELEFDEFVRADPDEFARQESVLRHALAERGIRFGDYPLPVTLKPHFVGSTLRRQLEETTGELVQAYLSYVDRLAVDAVALKELGVSKEQAELYALDSRVNATGGNCRPDVVWDDGQAWVLECNADSPAMMVYTDILQDHVVKSELFQRVAKKFECDLIQRTPLLLDTIVDHYRVGGGDREEPNVVLVDWPGVATLHEQEMVAHAFRERGWWAECLPPAALSYSGGRLRAAGREIDVVYRRVLAPDFDLRRDDLEPLIRAYKDGSVCMVNSLRGALASNKGVFARWAIDGGGDELSAAARGMIPEMLALSAQDAGRLLEEKSSWVLKPADACGGKNVTLGVLAPLAEWRDCVKTACREHWVAQRLLPIPRYHIPTCDTSRMPELNEFFVNANPFFFGGRPAGVLSRAGRQPVVGITARGYLMAPIMVR